MLKCSQLLIIKTNESKNTHFSNCWIITPLNVQLEMRQNLSLKKAFYCVFSMSVLFVLLYLGSQQHVVNKLHVRFHLSSLNIIQAVAQRVTLTTRK